MDLPVLYTGLKNWKREAAECHPFFRKSVFIVL